EIKFPNEDDFEFFQLDTIESLLDINTGGIVERFVINLACCDDATNRRLKDYKYEMDKAKELAQEYTDRYLPLEKEEISVIKNRLYEAIGHLSIFLDTQFSMELSRETENTPDFELDSSLYHYAETKNKTVHGIIQLVGDNVDVFRPKMSLFDINPELEEPFLTRFESMVEDVNFIGYALTLEDYNKLMGGLVTNPLEYIRDLESKWKEADGE
uniref:hypothetical protein n=1 Tax=Paraclostridium bifermentans TaxID=1490 RepID=UPI00374ED66E